MHDFKAGDRVVATRTERGSVGDTVKVFFKAGQTGTVTRTYGPTQSVLILWDAMPDGWTSPDDREWYAERGYIKPLQATLAEAFAALTAAMREAGCRLQGSDTQLAGLLCDAVDVISPSSAVAARDAAVLTEALSYISGDLGGLVLYPEDEA